MEDVKKASTFQDSGLGEDLSSLATFFIDSSTPIFVTPEPEISLSEFRELDKDSKGIEDEFFLYSSLPHDHLYHGHLDLDTPASLFREDLVSDLKVNDLAEDIIKLEICNQRDIKGTVPIEDIENHLLIKEQASVMPINDLVCEMKINELVEDIIQNEIFQFDIKQAPSDSENHHIIKDQQNKNEFFDAQENQSSMESQDGSIKSQKSIEKIDIKNGSKKNVLVFKSPKLPRGEFYLHDDRQKEMAEMESDNNGRLKSKMDNRWTHDLYDEYEQSTKEADELICVYGYNIREKELKSRVPQKSAKPSNIINQTLHKPNKFQSKEPNFSKFSSYQNRNNKERNQLNSFGPINKTRDFPELNKSAFNKASKNIVSANRSPQKLQSHGVVPSVKPGDDHNSVHEILGRKDSNAFNQINTYDRSGNRQRYNKNFDRDQQYSKKKYESEKPVRQLINNNEKYGNNEKENFYGRERLLSQSSDTKLEHFVSNLASTEGPKQKESNDYQNNIQRKNNYVHNYNNNNKFDNSDNRRSNKGNFNRTQMNQRYGSGNNETYYQSSSSYNKDQLGYNNDTFQGYDKPRHVEGDKWKRGELADKRNDKKYAQHDDRYADDQEYENDLSFKSKLQHQRGTKESQLNKRFNYQEVNDRSVPSHVNNRSTFVSSNKPVRDLSSGNRQNFSGYANVSEHPGQPPATHYFKPYSGIGTNDSNNSSGLETNHDYKRPTPINHRVVNQTVRDPLLQHRGGQSGNENEQFTNVPKNNRYTPVASNNTRRNKITLEKNVPAHKGTDIEIPQPRGHKGSANFASQGQSRSHNNREGFNRPSSSSNNTTLIGTLRGPSPQLQLQNHYSYSTANHHNHHASIPTAIIAPPSGSFIPPSGTSLLQQQPTNLLLQNFLRFPPSVIPGGLIPPALHPPLTQQVLGGPPAHNNANNSNAADSMAALNNLTCLSNILYHAAAATLPPAFTNQLFQLQQQLQTTQAAPDNYLNPPPLLPSLLIASPPPPIPIASLTAPTGGALIQNYPVGVDYTSTQGGNIGIASYDSTTPQQHHHETFNLSGHHGDNMTGGSSEIVYFDQNDHEETPTNLMYTPDNNNNNMHTTNTNFSHAPYLGEDLYYPVMQPSSTHFKTDDSHFNLNTAEGFYDASMYNNPTYNSDHNNYSNYNNNNNGGNGYSTSFITNTSNAINYKALRGVGKGPMDSMAKIGNYDVALDTNSYYNNLNNTTVVSTNSGNNFGTSEHHNGMYNNDSKKGHFYEHDNRKNDPYGKSPMYKHGMAYFQASSSNNKNFNKK